MNSDNLRIITGDAKVSQEARKDSAEDTVEACMAETTDEPCGLFKSRISIPRPHG